MLKRLICQCGFELSSPTHFCLNCGKKNAYACGIFVLNDEVFVKFFGEICETLTFKRYEDSAKILYGVLADKIYERRVEDVYVSSNSEALIHEIKNELENSFPFNVIATDLFESREVFFERLEKRLKVLRKLETVNIRPENKIMGHHSTIIGGKDGYRLVLKIAENPYVKKVVPGVIEAGKSSRGGVRIKLTRCDENGNIRALLVEGSTVQQLFVITTASCKEEGEEILKTISYSLSSNFYSQK
ncbi:MAG: DUF2103 domain-containing protein [Archaeoglobaceae archaeon]|nr:DUF2103 domain-containing protein [Archaeoglobaceae archaeon]MCX8151775.1 DUF2103 domain-containing protein [Archaeoglobaceae archaeon]MDW8013200.1 DUF2103 domain-containing protein [Archaeoglobaceae archaeon]